MGRRILSAIRSIRAKHQQRKDIKNRALMRAEEAELANRMIGFSGYVHSVSE